MKQVPCHTHNTLNNMMFVVLQLQVNIDNVKVIDGIFDCVERPGTSPWHLVNPCYLSASAPRQSIFRWR